MRVPLAHEQHAVLPQPWLPSKRCGCLEVGARTRHRMTGSLRGLTLVLTAPSRQR
jgi:hypothetical protein